MAGKQVLFTHNLHLVLMGQVKLYRETKRKSDEFTFYTRMKTTPICLTQNVTATIFRPRGLFFVCLVWAAFPMSIKGDFAVGLAQGNVWMSWRTNVTDISVFRFVVNPNGINAISFSKNNVTGTAILNYSSKFTEIGNVSLGIVSFRLLSLTLADAGRYYYKTLTVSDGGQVLVIAGIPTNITVMEVSDPFEKEKYTMQCSAQSTSVPLGMGLLTMCYQWKRENGQNINASDRYSFSSDQSNLIINPLQREDAGNFVCEAWEHIGAVSQSAPFSLKVIYGPDTGNIQLSPNRTSHEVAESSSLSVNCSTDCFPDCRYNWTGPDGLAKSETRMLSIISIGRNETGNFTCTAANSRNRNKTATLTINVVVFYGPDDRNVSLSPSNTSYQLIEMSRLDVKCFATCFPQCNYQWSGPLVSQNDTTGLLSISQISRNQTGTFSCSVTNPKISGKAATANLSVIVYYGPDIPHMLPSTTLYTKLEGESVPDINCSADCFPGCTQVWMNGSSAVQESNEKTLSLRQVTREKAGDYTCWFNNTESRATGNISFKLIVQYPPVLTMKATNTSKGGRVVINCTASGVPDNYTFDKLTHMAPDVNRTIVRELELTRVSNGDVSFTIENVTYQDTGFYVCKASNGIIRYSTGQLVMKDMVSVWITDLPVITSDAQQFDAEKGKTGHMCIEFYSGLFQPLVTWYIVNNDTMELLQNSSHFRIYLSAVTVGLKYYRKTIQLSGYNARLEVFDVDKEQFSSYKVEINNGFAESVFVTLQLKPRVITPDSSSTFSLPAVAGGIGAGVVIILMAVVALFLWRRYHHHSQHTDGTQRNQINAKSVRHDAASGQDYEGLHINNTEASAYLQLNDITLEENRHANTRPPENDSYEKLHPYANTDIQMYSSLKIPKISKDSENVYENTQIKATNFNC